MALANELPDDTYVHKTHDIELDAAFPFDDIILTGNVIPASTLQNLMPPLEAHMNLNYPYKTHKQTSDSESENENKQNNPSQPTEPKHDPINIFPPTLLRRIEMAEKRKTKTRKKKKKKKTTQTAKMKEPAFLRQHLKKENLSTQCAPDHLKWNTDGDKNCFQVNKFFHKSIIK